MALWIKLWRKKLKSFKRNYAMTFHINCHYNVSDNDLMKVLFEVSDELRIDIKSFNFNSYTKEVRIRCKPSEKLEFVKKFIEVVGNCVEEIKI